jgi:MFS family permease
MLGLGNIFWVPLMRVIGKRPVYLMALLILMVCNVWSYEAKSYGSLLGARIISGFAASAADATVPSLVTDLFFIHERGHLMMFFHLALSCGFFLGPFFEAFITQYAGWRWNCGFIAIVAAAILLVGIFTIHETSYPPGRADLDRPAESYPPKRTYFSKLALTHGYNKNASFFRSFFDIISLVAYPPVFWVGCTIGAFVGWNIVVQLTTARQFTQKPYNFQLHDIGLMSLSGFVGALLSFFLGGKLIDWISNRQTRKTAKRQPEYRLPAMIIPAVIGPMGILIFGLVVAHHKSWVGAAFGYAMQGFGITAVSNVSVTYAVDAYQPVSHMLLQMIIGC